jgi:membrane protease YdiL (CAAX protease family)
MTAHYSDGVTLLIAPLYHGYTALDLVIVALALFVMPALSFLNGRRLAREAPNARKLVPRYITIILRGLFFAAVVIGAWWVQGRPFGALGLTPHLGVWDYAGFALALLIGLGMAMQSFSLASAPDEKIARAIKAVHSIKITPNTRGELALFMAMSLSAGFWEELVYRGFLVWFLVPLAGFTGAVVISALIFGLAHLYQGTRGFLTSAVLGVIFAALYLLTASLWWLMAVHAVIDISGGITTFRIKRVAARRAVA